MDGIRQHCAACSWQRRVEPVAVATPVTITATQNGTGIAKSVVVNVVPAAAAPIADTIAVQKARFKFVGGRGGNIEVDATSSNPNAILTVVFSFPETSTGSCWSTMAVGAIRPNA